MPILTDPRKQVTVELPSIEGSEVTLRDGLLIKHLEQIGDFEKDKMKSTVKVLALTIEDWNLTDKDGKKLPVNEANIGMLTLADMQFLLSKINLNQDEEKKTK